MDENKIMKITEIAIEEVTKIFGDDPIYFGDEGAEDVYNQLRKMDYNIEDFKE